MVFGKQSLQGYESNRRMPTEFEWKLFPGITTSGHREKIESLMGDLQCKPEQFNDRIIIMPMYNDIE